MAKHLTLLLEADNRLQESFRGAEKGKPEGTTAGSALTVMSTAGSDSTLQVAVTEAWVFLAACPLQCIRRVGVSVCYQC